MHDVVVLGSVNLDLVATVTTLPRPGETVLAGAFREQPGGKGANQAVAAARLGARVALVGAVGDDESGRRLRSGLAGQGVDVDAVRSAGGRSGVALILVDADSENVVAVAPGANLAVGPGDARVAAELVAPGGVLLCQLEIPEETVRAAARAARRRSVTVVLNAAPVSAPDARSLAAADVDVLVVNETEAAALCGNAPGQWPWAAEAARLTVQRPGAQDAIPQGADVRRLLRARTTTPPAAPRAVPERSMARHGTGTVHDA